MIKVYDVKASHHYEAGNVITFQCPKCDDEISVSDAGWWRVTCSCGYKWFKVVYAYTEDGDEEWWIV